ncbi:transglycosylase domain-containing protein [Ureibacillus sinduriensis]|uniref:Penicillin-binding protein n=1 Tax=Ureibacillus sinduriensis BLB-1 = JCM 15800 TaxID=1384057 RepID=A0A0A3HUY7_9BACL|nr:transglycosylase domain-containing protein [Ureibacillus sinduriensis]KGR75040.1 penicillin-binding protein [Ureibacillus sinduriensis BLB-1 = JCM 15800]
MRQIMGFLLILCCFPLLVLFGDKILEEYTAAKDYGDTIQRNIQPPEKINPLPVTMFDRDGKVFSEEYVEWRQPVQLEAIPEIIKQIYLLSEDKEFYTHIGFNVSALTRALVVNAQGSIEQGGSTITQQLVRMRYLSAEQTYERKLTELFFAYELEQMYAKEEIFEMYLNEIYFGNQVYGINAAATYYFQKPLAELSIPQMAFIAAIPNNPSLYDPLKNFSNTKARQERLLDILAENEIISLEEAANFKQEEIMLKPKVKKQEQPAYSTFVLAEFKELVAFSDGYRQQLDSTKSEDEKSKIEEEIDAKVEQLLLSGISIHTALDAEKQQLDEQKIEAILGNGPLQSSSVVIDNPTREIVSVYGGKAYKKYDFHRAYQAVRQPGSAFKPLIVYGPLFETTNYSPRSYVSGGRYCVDHFCPQNYGGGDYGNVSISTAFKHSYNTSALRLLNEIGLETAFSYIEKFNFQSLVPEDKTFAAGLGGLSYGVTTLEMADAYTSFIDGTYIKARSIRNVTDSSGNVLYSWPTAKETVWSLQTVNNMRSLLHDVVTSGTGKGILLNSSYVGAKTGTTNDYKDFWIAGMTNEYTGAVWIGYDNPASMQSLQDDKIHFEIFNTIMD